MTTEVTPKVNVLLGLAKSASTLEDGSPKYTMTCTASSDEVDLGVDRFTLSALRQMAETFPGMTVFVNHKYSVPEDVFGVVTGARVVQRDGHNDLDLDIAVDTSNDRAMKVWQQSSNGVRLGISVGVLVNRATTSTEEVNGRKVKVLNIEDVTTLEVSVVGIPANRRSWVVGTRKAASYELLDPAERETLIKLVGFDQISDGGAEMALEKTAEEIVAEETGEVTLEDEETEDEAETSDDEATSDDDAEDEETGEDAGSEESEDDDEEPSPPPAGTEVPAARPESAVSDPEDKTIIIVIDDGEEEEPMESTSSSSPAPSPRAKVVAALRKAVSDADRDWFTVKAVEPNSDPSEPRTAEIFIYDAIGDGMGAKDFVDAVASIEADRINIRLNTPGGVITDGIAMRNALLRHGATLHTYVDGLAASMGSVIATAGHLTMEPGSMLMIHEPWGCAMGEAKDMEREARVLNKYGNNLAGVYAKKAGGTAEKWRAVMREEGWYGPEEAVKVGLADRVGDGTYKSEGAGKKVKEAKFDIGIFSLFKNAPEEAKNFFTAEAPKPDKAADASDLLALSKGVVELTGIVKSEQLENEELRARIKSLESDLDERNTQAEETVAVYAELMTEVNKIMDMAQPRKTAPEAAFDKFAEKYPHLDARILAQLARTSSS